MFSISQEQRAWENEEYGDLSDPEMEGPHCWYCAESLINGSHVEVVLDVDGMTMLVPVCDYCGGPPPPTPISARLACPICDEVLTPPRRHSCGGAAVLRTTAHEAQQ